jgi:CHAT domain-containing protein
MSAFFGNLTTDKRIATALREAQLQMIASRREQDGGAHPFFWSAFNVTETGR